MAELEELLLLAESQSWQERSAAGKALVARLGEPGVDAVILRLLLDAKDTAVTTATAEALLARDDLVSWRMFARAWEAATGTSSATDYIAHLHSSLIGAMYVASMDDEKAASLRGMVERLSRDEDERVRHAATDLRVLVLEEL